MKQITNCRETRSYYETCANLHWISIQTTMNQNNDGYKKKKFESGHRPRYLNYAKGHCKQHFIQDKMVSYMVLCNISVNGNLPNN